MTKKKTNICNYYRMLGNALYDYYAGKELSEAEITLIAVSTDKEKVFAMENFAVNNLKGQSYINFCQNAGSIARVRKK